jgi:tRNA-specific adenosine deaminase 3
LKFCVCKNVYDFLGSLFNHADPPNVSFTPDFLTTSIRYTTTRDILPDEELCIFYDHKLWFTPFREQPPHKADVVADTFKEKNEDTRDGLFELGSSNKTSDEEANEIMAEEDLPFTRLMARNSEEDVNAIRTGTGNIAVI